MQEGVLDDKDTETNRQAVEVIVLIKAQRFCMPEWIGLSRSVRPLQQ